MKKRIISMLLLVCMLVTALASCAYSYEKDDMSKYVTFDKAAFLDGLTKLEIEDADFGTDDKVREEKVWDAIYTALAGKADTDTHKTEGNPDAHDLLYYCYYATYTDGEGDAAKEVIVYASSMKESAAVKLQLGLTSNKDLNKAIADEVAKLITAEEGAEPAGLKYYATKTSGTVAGAATVVVTYTETKTSAEGATVKTTYTNKIVKVADECTGTPAEGSTAKTPTSFLEYLIGKSVNSTIPQVEYGTGADKVTYSGITVNWVIESSIEDKVVVKHTPFPDSKKEVKTVDGTLVDLNGKELTYHVYPVYFVKTPELTAEIILDKLLGTSFKAGGDADENGTIEDSEKGTLDVFTDSYKNGDETINAMITKLIELLSDRSTKETAETTAQSTYDTAKSNHDKATTPTQDQINALNTATTALEKAKTEAKEAKEKVADQIKKILAAKKDGSDVTIETAIVDSYKDYRYDTLENTYKSAIKSSLAQAIYDLAVKTIKYNDNLPEQAVNEAYDLLINNYEYEFYEGNYTSSSSSSSTSTPTKTNYEQYNGNFLSYLIAELGLKTTDTKETVYAAIREDAKTAVKEKILIYVLKSACADADKVEVTEADVDTFKESINYLLLKYYMGLNEVKESYYMPALQFDKVMNYFLEVDETAEGNEVKYVRISYTFKSKDEEAKDAE